MTYNSKESRMKSLLVSAVLAVLFVASLSAHAGGEGDPKSERDAASTPKQFAEGENPQEGSDLGSLPEEVLHRVTEFCSQDRLAYGASMRVCQKLYRISQEKKFRLNAIASEFIDKERALLDASLVGDLETVEALLFVGVDPNTKDHTSRYMGETPLHKAAKMDRTKVVELLLKNGANPNAQASHYWSGEQITPLIMAIDEGKGSYELVALLLTYGADPNLAKGTFTPLHFAANYGYFEIIQLLVDSGADVHATTHTSWTALSIAEHRILRKNNQLVVEYLKARMIQE
jgi:hypothetical protein